MNPEVKIESGVRRAPEGTFSKSPWPQMQVGDSVKLETISKARAAAKRASERWKPKKFEHDHDVDGNPRVWRTE